MKKVLGSIVIGFMIFQTTYIASAASPCDSMPPSLLSEWNNLTPEAQQSSSDYYCSGSVNPATTAQGGVNTVTTAPRGVNTVTTAPLASKTQLQNPIKYDTFSDFVSAITKTAVQVLMPFIVLAFIYSGFLFVRAQGNTEDLEKAKQAITWSVVGAFILLGAWGFAQIIGETISTITK